MLNLGIVTYASYVANYNTPLMKILSVILFIIAGYITLSQYLKRCRYDKIVKKGGHSLRFFDVTEQDRRNKLHRDLRSI